MNLSVVVPVFNSERSLEKLVDALEPVLSDVAEDFELILVDDNSRDHSWQVICALVEDKTWIRGFSLMRNYGQHNALLCGIREARHEVVVTMDDDLQNPPSEIPKMIECLDDETDVVYGVPEDGQHGIVRNAASLITKAIMRKAMGVEGAENLSAFRVFRRQLRDAFASYTGTLISIDVLLSWGTTRFGAVGVRHEPRAAGQSNYTLRLLVTHAVNMMTGFTTFPLQIASIVGFVMTIFGFLVLVYILTALVVFGRAVPGFAFLGCLIALFSGAQMFSIGIIGEYLSRMYFRTLDRPSFVVRKSCGGS